MISGAEDELVGLLAGRAGAGQCVLAAALRGHLKAHAPGVLDALSDKPGSDERLLEPMGFAAAAAGVTDADELRLTYAGATAEESRPRSLRVRADDRGRVFLPGLGYLVGLPAAAPVTVVRDDSELGYGGPDAVAIPLSMLQLRSGGPSLLPYPIAALERAGGTHVDGLAGVEHAANACRSALQEGLARIDAGWPELGRLLASVTRHIVLFLDPAENSFAKTSAHGVAFLNVALGDTPAFFVEDLPHQCGHLVFSAAWEAPGPLLTVPQDRTVGSFVDSRDERSIEVALHGMVTQTLMVAALGRALEGASDAREYNELTGRLLFALMRLGLDLRMLAPLSIYADPGARLMRSLLGCYALAARTHGEGLTRADFSGQPYNFDWPVYEQRNEALLVS